MALQICSKDSILLNQKLGSKTEAIDLLASLHEKVGNFKRPFGL